MLLTKIESFLRIFCSLSYSWHWLLAYLISAMSHTKVAAFFFDFSLYLKHHSLSELPFTTLVRLSQFPLSVLPPLPISAHWNSFFLHPLIFTLSQPPHLLASEPSRLLLWLTLPSMSWWIPCIYFLPRFIFWASPSTHSFPFPLSVLSVSSFIYIYIYPSI